MLKLLISLGGFIVGGGSVYAYAKATNQTIEWRGVPGVGWFCERFTYSPPKRRTH